MADYSHLPVGTHVVEDTPHHQLIVDRSDAGWTERFEWKLGQEPVTLANERMIRQRLATAIGANQTYLVIASPTASQVRDQTERLTREVNGLLRLLLNDLADVSDT